MKKITLLGSMLLLTLTIACSSDSANETTPPVEENCNCSVETVKVNNQTHDTIYKSGKVYVQNAIQCGTKQNNIVPSESNQFVTTYWIVDCTH